MKKTLLFPLVAGLALLAVPGCVVPINALPDGTGVGATGSSGIVINGLSANPTGSDITAGEHITFTVSAFDANGLPMQYTWSSTEGTLSTTQGQTVSWSPFDANGQVAQGVATVMALVTDSSGASQVGAVNLQIAPNTPPTGTTATASATVTITATSSATTSPGH